MLRDQIRDESQAFILVSALALGDTHLVAALCPAFRQVHCDPGDRIVLVVKEAHREFAEMFPGIDRVVGVPEHELEDAVAVIQQPQGAPQRGVPYFVHPEIAAVRPQRYVMAGRMTDAAMYALILGVPPDAAPSLPVVPAAADEEARAIVQRTGVIAGRTVLVITGAHSWRPPPEAFWTALAERLSRAGWSILISDDDWPVPCLLSLAELCGWVIGTQSGLIQAIVASEIRCRKTVLTTVISIPGQPSASPFPYRWMRTVLGRQYDIEEFAVDPDNFAGLVEEIAVGRNALGDLPDPRALTFVEGPTSPGDLVDRLTILYVKRSKMPEKAHLLARAIGELEPVCAAFETFDPRVAKHKASLIELNTVAWDANAVLIEALPRDSDYGAGSWRLDGTIPDAVAKAESVVKSIATAHRANIDRVRLKNEIDALCHAGVREEKAYAT